MGRHSVLSTTDALPRSRNQYFLNRCWPNREREEPSVSMKYVTASSVGKNTYASTAPDELCV